MKRTLLLIMLILAMLAPTDWLVHMTTLAQRYTTNQTLSVYGRWSTHDYDLIYTVAFSRAQQPEGPLVVYRASGSDLRNNVAVSAIARGPQVLTPLFFPSPKGQYLALLAPLQSGFGTSLNGAALRIISTDGQGNTLLVPGGVAYADQPVWSADSQALYYASGEQAISSNTLFSKSDVRTTLASNYSAGRTTQPVRYHMQSPGYEEIHRVDLHGHDVMLLRRAEDDSSLHLVGVDRTGGLIVTWARPQQPVVLLRLDTSINQEQGVGTRYITSHGVEDNRGLRATGPMGRDLSRPYDGDAQVIATLPSDILPGNVLRVGSDGASVMCERVLSWQPLRYTLVNISFGSSTVTGIRPTFDTAPFGYGARALNRSSDGRVLVMSQVLSERQDLAMQGIADVPAQEKLIVADATSGATQGLTLPAGGQIVQTFWAARVPLNSVRSVPADVLAGLLTYHKRTGNGSRNASVFQKDEWMLEGHAGKLYGAPALPSMCYGTCPQGAIDAPHVSAAILHGVAYVETNWHQFNTPNYDVNGEAVGSPVKSFDGGWGEYQQTWGMPPQCLSGGNCRDDVAKIQQEESYNVGTGVQALISAWNGTAGVASSSDPNDPYKANDWFFAVWAYNGAYGNNPNDVPSSIYGHWYPGAPFRSIYEEYVWYFAAHPQYTSNGWTDNYLPNLGTSLLPPQSAFAGTSDSFVACVSCTIPDWTAGTFDRDWVGVGAPDAATAGYFKTLYAQSGGEDVVGLPRDNTGGAALHHWANGWIQDFGGGSYLPGAFMLLDHTTIPYWIYGGVWTQYVTADAAATGCHGYPTSALTAYADPSLGPDSYFRQTFQAGSIIWDATKQMVAADVCK